MSSVRPLTIPFFFANDHSALFTTTYRGRYMSKVEKITQLTKLVLCSGQWSQALSIIAAKHYCVSRYIRKVYDFSSWLFNWSSSHNNELYMIQTKPYHMYDCTLPGRSYAVESEWQTELLERPTKTCKGKKQICNNFQTLKCTPSPDVIVNIFREWDLL